MHAYMKENGVDRLTVEVTSTYVFELEDYA